MTSFADVRLATPRLELRPLVPADAPALFAVFSDPRVMRYWSSPPWASVAVAEEHVERHAAAMAAGEYLVLGIVRRDDGLLLGDCTLFDFSVQCRRAELGYGLRADAWGRGYAAEAVGELLRYGFTDLDLHRVEADADPRNAASLRLLERLGFTREGLLRERWIVAGEVSDTAFFGLLRREWEARRDAPPASRNVGDGVMPVVTTDAFAGLDLRVGRVVAAEPFAQARTPAYVLRVDFGPGLGVRKSSARITELYAPVDLVGRLVVAVVNLPPKQVGPHMSECLVTGFPDAEGRVVLCAPERPVAPGARLF